MFGFSLYIRPSEFGPIRERRVSSGREHVIPITSYEFVNVAIATSRTLTRSQLEKKLGPLTT